YFVSLPGLDAPLEIESEILQLAAGIGIVDVVPVVGELDHGFAAARTGSRPAPLQIAAVIIGMPLHSNHRRLDSRIAQRILPIGLVEVALNRPLVLLVGLPIHPETHASAGRSEEHTSEL